MAVFKKKGYNILNVLGKGAFGTVYKAMIETTGELSACKVIGLEKLKEKGVNDKFLEREMAAMIESKHPNVIQLFDIIRANKRIYIFMEFAPNGDIMGYMKRHPGGIPLEKLHYWFRGSCEGINYLHSKLHIAHRDLKVDNILLSESNVPKIGDFGFAQKAYDQEKRRVILNETFCGTEPYKCPQLIRKEKYDPFKADVWAMGVVLFGMINDKFQFDFGDTFQMNKQIESPEHLNNRYKKEYCKHLKHLVSKMLEPIEKDRFKMTAVLEHKWIKAKLKCCPNVNKLGPIVDQ